MLLVSLKIGLLRSIIRANLQSFNDILSLYFALSSKILDLTAKLMNVALTWLKEENVALGELADRLGYQSEAAFSRAFKRFIGVSPGAARRNGHITTNS